jgi:hypothetical protein
MNNIENTNQVVSRRIAISWEKVAKMLGKDIDALEAIDYLHSFNEQALYEKWTPVEVLAVMIEAVAGDFEHLKKTIAIHCEICGR